jgi:acyl-CoA thioesterase II
MMASLDHSIYFHKQARADEWLLYDMNSTWSGRGRALAHGRIFTREGELIAECVQEGLIRMKL